MFSVPAEPPKATHKLPVPLSPHLHRNGKYALQFHGNDVIMLA